MARLIILIAPIALMLSMNSCIEKPIQSDNNNFRSLQVPKSSSALIRYTFIPNENKVSISVRYKKSSNSLEFVPDFDFERLVREYHSTLQKFSLPKKNNHKQFIKQSHELYSVLIAPISKLIHDKESLIIDIKGHLQLIPFETLVKNDKIKPFEKTDFLIKDFNIKYLSDKTTSPNRANQYKNTFLGFAPGFEKGNNKDLALAQNLRNQIIQPLPFSKKEVTEIGNLWGNSPSLKTQLLNKKANKKNLKIHLSKNYKYVHIASHGFSDFESERSPRGVLCAQKEGKNQTLNLNEISKMKINSDLVVLSICESGLGKITNEKMKGLHSGFLEAGVSNVVYSLWKVNDKRTAELMTTFYRGFLKRNQSYSESLRKAKLKLLANPVTSSPNIWASFVLASR